MAFRRHDKVKTSTGFVGKVLYTDTARGLVAIEATEDGVGHSKGAEKVFKDKEVRKA